MAASNPAEGQNLHSDVESFDILPDPTRKRKLSWIEVKCRMPKAKVKGVKIDGAQLNLLLSMRNSKEFGELSEEIFPPRTKTDLALRRTRLLDWVKYFRRNRSDEMMMILANANQGWDMIFMTNILAASAVLGIEWYSQLDWLGCFDGDLEHFILVTKKLNDTIKTVGVECEDWTIFVECSNLSGYRNTPFPGFNVVEEAKLLAEGGEDHDYFGHEWKDLCKEFLPMEFVAVPYLSFSEWVASAEWSTSGASSVGSVLLKLPDGKVKRIKARKNMVADVIDLGELAEEAIKNEGQQNFTIIKSELGKLRLAVAGDIYTYLKMAWITRLLGGTYKDWPGSTTEEDFSTQTKRLAKMLELCSTKFGLPYDYAGFDHQPTTKEIVAIAAHLCDHARLNVPDFGKAEFSTIEASVLQGFNQATLETRIAGEPNVKYRVTGGLGSGLAWTSIIGNAWNSVVTGLALKLLASWGISTASIERFIRGDDSAIFVPNWATGAAMNLAYEAIGARAGAGKFSLQNKQMEFLRTWFDTRCRGYACRAIPGLTQRKPWSSNPWSEDMVIRAIYEAVRTLRRRTNGRDKALDDIWSSLRHIWCQNHNLPDAVCWTPVFGGGFGIEPPKIGQEWKIVPPVPIRPKILGVSVINQRSWRADKLRQYASEKYQIELGVVADEIAAGEILDTIKSDNVPQIATLVRDEWLREVRKSKCRAVVKNIDLNFREPTVSVNAYDPSQVDALLDRLKASAPDFGSCPEVVTARADYDKYKPGYSFSLWLKKFFPRVATSVRRFHHTWHMSERLDYLAGNLALVPKILHPALVKILAWSVASSILPRHRSNRYSSVWLGSIFETSISQSPISKMTYWW